MRPATRSTLRPDGTRVETILDPTGNAVPDLRVPFWHCPTWVADPVRSGCDSVVADDEADARVVLGDRYAVDGALSFSASGGVYVATDLDSGDLVVVKEARSHIGDDSDGHLAVELLEREFQVLDALREVPCVPTVRDLFWHGEHRYLVEDHVEGSPLGRILIGANPVWEAAPSEDARREHREFLHRLWRDLARAVAEIHEKGVVIGDLSLMNILVADWSSPDMQLTLIDFEGAWRSGLQAPRNVYTPGFAPGDPGERGVADDVYALGRVCLSALIPVATLAAVSNATANRLFERAAARLDVATEFVELFMAMTDRNAQLRPDMATVERVLADPARHSATLGEPRDDAESDASWPQLRESIVRGITQACDPGRRDRLFASEPELFRTNPIGLANGAAGVLRTLHAVGEEVPAHWISWMLAHPLGPDALPPGLFAGSTGVGVALFDLGYDELGAHLIKTAADHPLLSENPSVAHGAAGSVLANLWLHERTGDASLLARAQQLGELIISSAVPAGLGTAWVDSSGRLPVGLADGAAGVSLALLYLWLASGDERMRICGQEAVDFVIGTHIERSGSDYWSFPTYYERRGRPVLRHYWADGSAGVGTALLRWESATGLESATECLDRLMPDTERPFTVFPSLFVGLSGLGMFQLDRHALRGDDHGLECASVIGRTIQAFRVERDGWVGFPGSQLQRMSAGLGGGAAGVLLFLDRLATAEARDLTRCQVLPEPTSLLRSITTSTA